VQELATGAKQKQCLRIPEGGIAGAVWPLHGLSLKDAIAGTPSSRSGFERMFGQPRACKRSALETKAIVGKRPTASSYVDADSTVTVHSGGNTALSGAVLTADIVKDVSAALSTSTTR
jgi:hypothetical protein